MADSRSSETVRNTAGLEVVLAKDTFVLPWSHFLFAKGGSDEVYLAFSTHNIVVTGVRLDRLLSLVNSQQVSHLTAPTRADGFGRSPEYQITGITVEKCDD